MGSVTIQLELPEDWTNFSLPPALDTRLAALLDRHDIPGSLIEAERLEADALCKLVDMLALLRLRAKRVTGRS